MKVVVILVLLFLCQVHLDWLDELLSNHNDMTNTTPLYVPSKELETYIDRILSDVYYYKDRGTSYSFVHACTKRIMDNLYFDVNKVPPSIPTATLKRPLPVQGLPKLLVREDKPVVEKIEKQNKMKGRGGPRWTKTETEKLLLLVSTYTCAILPPNWTEISKEFNGRSEYAIYEKYTILTGSWTTIRKKRNCPLQKL